MNTDRVESCSLILRATTLWVSRTITDFDALDRPVSDGRP